MRKTFLVAALAALLQAVPATAGSYSFLDLGTLGGSFSNALAVNSAGQVAGYSWLPGDSGAIHAVVWNGGGISDLGTLGGTSSQAGAINDAGLVGGGSAQAGNTTSPPILWQSGATVLPTLGGSSGYVYALKANGQAVGFAATSTGVYVATAWSGGVASAIGPLDGRASVAMGVNSLGQVVGAVADRAFNVTPGALRPVAWHVGGWSFLGMPLASVGGYAAAVNDAGLAAGYTRTMSDEYAITWSLATLQPTVLPRLGGSYARATGVNSLGDVVGYSGTAAGDQHAFIWSGGTLVDLNFVVDSSGVGWTLEAANAINNDGQIVGFARNALGQQHAYLLSPVAAVPEPSSVLLLLLAMPLIAFKAARRDGGATA